VNGSVEKNKDRERTLLKMGINMLVSLIKAKELAMEDLNGK
jgi:hypothetical protein